MKYIKKRTNIKGTTENFIIKSKLVHGNKYDYSLVNYIGAKHRIKLICYIHGIFEQQPSNHLSGSGCGKCSGNVQSTTNEFIQKANVKHKNKYVYTSTIYHNDNTKLTIICQTHGEFIQKAGNHLRGDGCSLCTKNKRLTKSLFIELSNKKHRNNYDYLLVDYINNSTKVKIICHKHGIFEQNPNNHINGNGCPICKESKGERDIGLFLGDNNIKFIRQYTFSNCRNILPLPFDFYLPEYNTCIEFQGRQHYTPIKIWGGEQELEKIKHRDKIKMGYCRDNNIPLVELKYSDNIFKKLRELINPKT